MPSLNFPVGQVNVEGLQLLAAGLERLTGGGKIEIRQMVVVETENMAAFWALEDMLSKDYMKALPAGQAPIGSLKKIELKTETAPGTPVKAPEQLFKGQESAVKTPKARLGRPRKTQPADHVGKLPDVRSVVFQSGERKGERISMRMLNNELEAHTIAPGTQVYHPRRGHLVVNAIWGLDEVAKEKTA